MAHTPNPSILQNDFLRGLFSLHPAIVGAAFLVTGWGSLLLIAWRTSTITSTFLKSPGFMIGDLLLLPLAGSLVTAFYQRADQTPPLNTGRRIVLVAAALATLATLLATGYSTLISKNYHGLWSVPHTLFIWLIAYVMISYFVICTIYLLQYKYKIIWLQYCGIIIALIGHVTLKLATDSGSITA